MDITLKQKEIEIAVRNYVAEKIGIDLTGKSLNINFSMGRGLNALIANLSITDQNEVEIPGFTDRPADKHHHETSKTDGKSAEVHTLPVAEAKEAAADEPAKTVPAEEVPVAAATDAPATTDGLFGQP